MRKSEYIGLSIILVCVMAMVAFLGVRYNQEIYLKEHYRTQMNLYTEKCIYLEKENKEKDEEIKKLKDELALTKQNVEYLTALSPLKGLISDDEISELVKEIPHGNPFRSKFIVTSKYGERTLNYGSSVTVHNGVDIIPIGGDLTITPISSGEVINYGYDKIYGKYVTIQHTPNLRSVYCHGDKIYWAGTTGRKVDSNTAIMLMGNSGYVKKETGNGGHLHIMLEVLVSENDQWVPVDPLPFLEECYAEEMQG